MASGLPVYRGSATSRYEQPDALREAMASNFRADPEAYWRRHALRREEYSKARPNAAHRALARFARGPRRLLLVTQNVDDLHARAGSWPVVELHGNAFTLRCIDDGCREPKRRDPTDPDLVSEIPAPRCSSCGASMRPDMVLFGEGDESRWDPVDAFLSEGLDLVLVVGTSGVVAVLDALLQRLFDRALAPLVVEVNPKPVAQELSQRFGGRGRLEWVAIAETAELGLPSLLGSKDAEAPEQSAP